MLAPALAQAPAMIDSSRGWSGATMVSSVMERNLSVATSLAKPLPCCHSVRIRRASRMRLDWPVRSQ